MASTVIVQMVEPAVDAINKLSELKMPPEGALQGFEDALFQVLSRIQKISMSFLEEFDKTAEFATNVTYVVDMVAPAIEAMNSLSNLKLPTGDALQGFEDALWQVITRIKKIKQSFSGNLAGVAEFSGNVSVIMGSVGEAIDSMNKLSEFKLPTGEALKGFEDALWQMLTRIGNMGKGFDKETMEGGTTFGKYVSGVSGSVDASLKLLDKIREYKPVPPEKFDSYFGDLARLGGLPVSGTGPGVVGMAIGATVGIGALVGGGSLKVPAALRTSLPVSAGAASMLGGPAMMSEQTRGQDKKQTQALARAVERILGEVQGIRADMAKNAGAA